MDLFESVGKLYLEVGRGEGGREHSAVRMRIRLGPLHDIWTRHKWANQEAIRGVRDRLIPAFFSKFRVRLQEVVVEHAWDFTGHLLEASHLIKGVVPDRSEPNRFIVYGSIVIDTKWAITNRYNPPVRYWQIYAQGLDGISDTWSTTKGNFIGGPISRVRTWYKEKIGGMRDKDARNMAVAFFYRRKNIPPRKYPAYKMAVERVVDDDLPAMEGMIESIAKSIAKALIE